MSIAHKEEISSFYLVNIYILQILTIDTPRSLLDNMALRATATITNENAPPTTTSVNPDSIVEIQGKTYVNMQPLQSIPPFPIAFALAGMDMDGFMPIEPDNAFNQGYVDGMANNRPFQPTPSTAATEQCRQWL